MEDNIIKIEGLVKHFKEAKAVNNVSVNFEKNKIHGIIGRNGSGKTVLFKCICGLMYPDAGTVTVRGIRVGKDVDIPPNIGSIIEAPGFLPNYSAVKNLQFLAGINRKIDKEQIKQNLIIVGLDPESKKHVGKYSLGMRQRLGIAQAIMEGPDILIFDEPMNGLDRDGVKEIRDLLLDLKQKGTTILLASHSKEDIDVLCDTVHEMHNGVIEVVK